MSDLDQPAVGRPLLIGLGAVVVLALVWLLVLGPRLTGGDDDLATPIVTPNRTAPAPAPSPAPGDDLYPETTEVFAARDPFDQLVAAAAEPAPGVGTPGGPPGPSTPGSTPVPTTSPGSGPSEGPSGGGGGGGSGRPRSGSSAEVGGTEIKLIDVYDGATRAVVTVNGRSYDVAEGETFAERFRLLDLDGECGTFLFGDSRFVLCEGDEIRK